MLRAVQRVGRPLGRYALFEEIAAGGMGTVHLGTLLGSAGFARTVAIKRLLPEHAHDPGHVGALLTEARLAARVRHPNVVPTLDVVEDGDAIAVVMEWVLGESAAGLLKALVAREDLVPLPIAARIVLDALQGLHAAHEATAEDGRPLGLVHRDVSPQNFLVGVDGTTRVLDFGIAKRSLGGGDERTQSGVFKGKLGYAAPEQLLGEGIDRRVDVYAAAVVLWELVARTRLFPPGDDRAGAIVRNEVPLPSSVRDGVPVGLDVVVMRGLARSPADRYPTAREMAIALEDAVPPASAVEVAAWVEDVAADAIAERREAVRRVEAVAAPLTFEEPTTPFALAPRKAEVAPPADAAPAPAPKPAIAAPPPTSGGPEPIVIAFGVLAALGVAGLFAAYLSHQPPVKASAPAAAASSSASASTSAAPPSASSSAPPAASSAAAPAAASSPCARAPLRGVIALAAGPASHHTCARREGGAVVCWGDNAAGQLGVGDRAPHPGARAVDRLGREAIAIAVGADHTCALDDAHDVRCWGHGRLVHPTEVIGLHDVAQVAAGGRHDCALRSGGAVDCWGDDASGQLGSTTRAAALAVRVEGLPAITSVAAGGAHSCAIARGGDVHCWGANDLGQLGGGTTDADAHPYAAKVPGAAPAVAIAAGDKTTFALDARGDVKGWGFAIKRPVAVPIRDVVELAAGGRVSCARTRIGAVYCWGFDEAGELGGDRPEDSATPRKIDLGLPARSIAAGDAHVCALDSAGSVLCWGSNAKGELGLAPDEVRHPKPVEVTLDECPR
jgi:serine/threonine-protein kinase